MVSMSDRPSTSEFRRVFSSEAVNVCRDCIANMLQAEEFRDDVTSATVETRKGTARLMHADSHLFCLQFLVIPPELIISHLLFPIKLLKYSQQ